MARTVETLDRVTISVDQKIGMSGVPAIEMRGITKRFEEVIACDGVELSVERGEIHGLLGQNGAGKSTLMKILVGLSTADAGSILLNGKLIVVKDPVTAAQAGIAMVHQHYSVISALTVWENVELGGSGRLDPENSIREVSEIAERYGLDIDPRARVGDLTVGQRQRVEIIKCLRRHPTVLVMDEPTSVLTLAESEELFNTLRHVVKEEGRAVVLISHKLDEIMHATDQVTIMRGGKVVKRVMTKDTDVRTLARQMVGREISQNDLGAGLGITSSVTVGSSVIGETKVVKSRDPVVRVLNATVRGSHGRLLLNSCSFEIYPGEILGVAGVDGNGQVALAGLFHNVVALSSGTIDVNGTRVRTQTVGAMNRAGVAVIPENRHELGCVLDMTVAENLIFDDIDKVCRHGFLSQKAIHDRAVSLVEQMEIKTPSVDTPMWKLSGGNQQRVVLARAMASEPRVLIAAQPTHGLDVAAVQYINEQLRKAAASGMAVLLISTELEEVLGLSDRIAVIHRGRIVGQMMRYEADLERIGLLMGGEVA